MTYDNRTKVGREELDLAMLGKLSLLVGKSRSILAKELEITERAASASLKRLYDRKQAKRLGTLSSCTYIATGSGPLNALAPPEAT